jgi:hypothetical protein
MRFLPAFVRRAVLMRRARELVQAGDGRAALLLLADPLFDGVPAARELAREAEAQAAPEPNGARTSITEMLARLREERARRGPGNGEAAASAEPTAGAAAAPEPNAGACLAFRLAVDDAGEYLVVVGTNVLIGHESSTRADLRFLANVEREHARLVFANDFHAGPTWRVVPVGGARASVDGRAVAAGGAVITDGQRVVLGKNLAWRFRAEGPSSSSAVLEFEHGIECHGAGRLLLLAPGPDGRVQIASSARRPIKVGGLAHAVTLEITATLADVPEARLSIGCEAGLARGVRPAEGAPTSLSILVPPRASERFTFAARAAGEAPFEIVVAPVEEGPG